MPDYTRKFTLTVSGEITITADTQKEADGNIKHLDAHTLLSHIVIDDPYADFDIEVERGDEDDTEDWEHGEDWPENDLLPDQDAYGDDYPDQDGPGF